MHLNWKEIGNNKINAAQPWDKSSVRSGSRINQWHFKFMPVMTTKLSWQVKKSWEISQMIPENVAGRYINLIRAYVFDDQVWKNFQKLVRSDYLTMVEYISWNMILLYVFVDK